MGISMARMDQMKDLVLSFHLVYWTTHATIFRPHTDHEGECSGMKLPAIVFHWHPSDPSILHGHSSNHLETIRNFP